MPAGYSYTAVFEPAEEGGFVVTFPAIPVSPCKARPSTRRAKWRPTALRAYLESLAKNGEKPR